MEEALWIPHDKGPLIQVLKRHSAECWQQWVGKWKTRGENTERLQMWRYKPPVTVNALGKVTAWFKNNNYKHSHFSPWSKLHHVHSATSRCSSPALIYSAALYVSVQKLIRSVEFTEELISPKLNASMRILYCNISPVSHSQLFFCHGHKHINSVIF